MSALPKKHLITNNCTNRIKPSLLRDVKTEAILVFARTALERYFKQLDTESSLANITTDEDSVYVYETLKSLLVNLQENVVNVDYLITLVQYEQVSPQARLLKKQEEPLMEYYNCMAQQVKNHFNDDLVYLPAFLVITVLAEWTLGQEKSTSIYPFLDEIDFLELMASFEKRRESFANNDSCHVSDIHELSLNVVERLKNFKYKINKKRVSKTRKK